MDAAAYQTGFIAVGTGGRMDYISVSGDVQTIQTPVDCTLLDTAVYEDSAVTVGREWNNSSLAGGRNGFSAKN